MKEPEYEIGSMGWHRSIIGDYQSEIIMIEEENEDYIYTLKTRYGIPNKYHQNQLFPCLRGLKKTFKDKENG